MQKTISVHQFLWLLNDVANVTLVDEEMNKPQYFIVIVLIVKVMVGLYKTKCGLTFIKMDIYHNIMINNTNLFADRVTDTTKIS